MEKKNQQASLPTSLQNTKTEIKTSICSTCKAVVEGIWHEALGRILYFCEECSKREKIKNQQEKKTKLTEHSKRIADDIKNILYTAGVPKRFIEAAIEGVPEKYRAIDLEQSYYLHGEPGRGKTHIAVALLRERILSHGRKSTKSINAVFIPINFLLVDIRASFSTNDGDSEKTVILKYTNADILILDDLGVEKTTDWSLQTLYTIVNERYNNMKQTIITSNLNLDELSSKFHYRIASRLAELCKGGVLEVGGQDRRLEGGKTK